MAVYRGKYILEGLPSISPGMEHNLDLAYDICMSYKGRFPCEMCGRCCHQPHIVVRPDEIDRVASAAGILIPDFLRDYLVRTDDGRFLFKRTDPCAFLGPDRRCTIWRDRPQICDDFPYAVSMFMSRVYLALVNPDADIMSMISYMDDSWPCTREIRRDIAERVEAARPMVVPQRSQGMLREERPDDPGVGVELHAVALARQLNEPAVRDELRHAPALGDRDHYVLVPVEEQRRGRYPDVPAVAVVPSHGLQLEPQPLRVPARGQRDLAALVLEPPEGRLRQAERVYRPVQALDGRTPLQHHAGHPVQDVLGAGRPREVRRDQHQVPDPPRVADRDVAGHVGPHGPTQKVHPVDALGVEHGDGVVGHVVHAELPRVHGLPHAAVVQGQDAEPLQEGHHPPPVAAARPESAEEEHGLPIAFAIVADLGTVGLGEHAPTSPRVSNT